VELNSGPVTEQREWERLFGEPGWHRLVAEWRENIEAIKATALYMEEKDRLRHRYRVEFMEELIRLPDTKLTQPPEDDSHPYER
jgi:hypothetical protein